MEENIISFDIKQKIYYELALLINKNLYEEKIINQTTYLKTEQLLLKKVV